MYFIETLEKGTRNPEDLETSARRNMAFWPNIYMPYQDLWCDSIKRSNHIVPQIS
jgi:hypothetical protein